MRGIAQAVARRRPGSSKRLVSEIEPATRTTERLPSPAGLASLANGCGDVLPSLQSVPSQFHLEMNGELLYSLCIALLERKLIDEELWLASGKIPVVFARNAVQKILERFPDFQYVDYSLEICDEPDSGYRSSDDIFPSSLLVMFELQSTGVLAIGNAMNALDLLEVNLGAAFYIVLTSALWKWMFVYDHTSAERYNEQLQEMMEQDDEDNRDQYEFPDLEKAIPPSVIEVDRWPPSSGEATFTEASLRSTR